MEINPRLNVLAIVKKPARFFEQAGTPTIANLRLD
jgi:hypothetical protein